MLLARVLALSVVLTATASAQRYGSLYGRVVDTSSGGIAEASLTVTNQDTGFRRTAQSEPGGTYSVGSLQAGTYKITVRKEGFASVACFDVQVRGQAPTRADFVMTVGSVETTITVVGNPTPFDREQEDASQGRNFERADLERLPLNGRGVLSLLELTPGTNVTPATRGEAGQFSASGQRPNTNYFTVDGVSANTGVTAGGLPAQSNGGAFPPLSAFGSLDAMISLEAVQEFRVTTSTSIAEFGRMPGALVALSSRSGSSEFHGTTGYRIRNELLSANDWFGNQAGYGSLPLRLHDFTQTLGGPIRRNRTFFFLSYQRMSLRQPFVWRQPVPTAEVRKAAADWAQPLLGLFPQPGAATATADVGEWVGRSERPASLHAGGVRVDHSLTSRISLFGRYNDSPSRNQFGTLAVNDLNLRSRSLTLGASARITSGLVLDFRANESQAQASSQWRPNDGPACALEPLASFFLRAPASCDYLVRFSIGGVGQLVSGREGDRKQRQFQTIPSASWRWRTNLLAGGVDYRRILAIRRDHTGTLGVIADELRSLESTQKLWISTTPGQVGSTEVEEISAWLQDTWQVSRRLTLTGGVRWEYSPAPLPDGDVYFLEPARNIVVKKRQRLWPERFSNVAPRFGMALRLTGDGRTVLRAGGGLHYESSLSIANDFLNGGPLSVSSFHSSFAGIFPASLDFAFMPDLRLPEVRQWSVSVERAVTAHDVVSLGYVGAAGRYLLRREVGGAGNSPTSFVALTTNHGSSNYQALQLQYRRRVARGLQSMASFAWSHSIDNSSSDSTLVWAGPGAGEKGSSDFDLRQAFTGALTYEFADLVRGRRIARFTRGWAIDGVVRARSGFPVSVLNREEYVGINLANAFRPDWNYGQPLWVRAPGTPGGRVLNPAAFHVTVEPKQGTLGRNVLDGFGMAQLDMALRREFRVAERRRLQLRVEAYNLLNHASFADPVKYLNSPVFGQSTSMLNVMLGTGSPGSGLSPILQTGGPRSLQGTIRFQF